MNYKMVGFVLGRIFLIEAALMLFPMGCAAIYGEWSVVLSFLWPTLIVLALGLITSLRTPQNTKIYARDGLAIVALVWVLMSVFGALPFVISGEIPSFVDAFFETVSGFTTTGSTILTDVEALSHGTLFWRSFSHWIGGMGVLVFAMAVLPMTDGRAMHLMRAEVPGPTCGKISSKLSDSAKILYAIYFVMTVIEMILLSLDGFDLVTTFTSVATCLNNVGPGLEMVGPMGSFADFSAPAKLLLAFDMLAGRLELYPMLALFAPRLWRKRINAMHEARAK